MNSQSRNSYQQRLQQRQTVIFGSIGVLLTLLLVLGLLWFTNVLPFPANKEFSAETETEDNVVPCLVEGTTSVDPASITVRVYNASARTGLAGSVGGKLSEYGVVISDELNWGGSAPQAPAVIYSSLNALPQAYSLARMFPTATVLLDGTTDTEVLDLVLGEDFTELRPDGELAELQAGQDLTNPENCVVVDR